MAFHVACPITWYVISLTLHYLSPSLSRSILISRPSSQPSDLLLLPRVPSRSPCRRCERGLPERRSPSGGFSDRSLGLFRGRYGSG